MKITKTGYYGHDKLDGKDDRSDKWKEQRKKDGFDSSELWSLGDTIVNFSLPRIKRMMEIEKETNLDFKDIEKDYLKLIEGLELFVRNEGDRIWNQKETAKVNKALKNFGILLPIMWF